jgi:menaquinone-dependent protoporphyrinogen oxidase
MQDTPAVFSQRKPVAVLYGASTDHTSAIAERVAAGLRACGFPVEIHSVRGLAAFDLGRCVGAVLAASMDVGQHDEAMVEFVKAHREELDRLPVAFISITLSETGAQRPDDASERRDQFEGDVQMAPNPFFAAGWLLTRIKSFAGSIVYTRYNFFVRIAMKLLAPKQGAGGAAGDQPDARWDALDVFVNEFVEEIDAAEVPAPTEPPS